MLWHFLWPLIKKIWRRCCCWWRCCYFRRVSFPLIFVSYQRQARKQRNLSITFFLLYFYIFFCSSFFLCLCHICLCELNHINVMFTQHDYFTWWIKPIFRLSHPRDIHLASHSFHFLTLSDVCGGCGGCRGDHPLPSWVESRPLLHGNEGSQQQQQLFTLLGSIVSSSLCHIKVKEP